MTTWKEELKILIDFMDKDYPDWRKDKKILPKLKRTAKNNAKNKLQKH